MKDKILHTFGRERVAKERNINSFMEWVERHLFVYLSGDEKDRFYKAMSVLRTATKKEAAAKRKVFLQMTIAEVNKHVNRRES